MYSNTTNSPKEQCPSIKSINKLYVLIYFSIFEVDRWGYLFLGSFLQKHKMLENWNGEYLFNFFLITLE